MMEMVTLLEIATVTVVGKKDLYNSLLPCSGFVVNLSCSISRLLSHLWLNLRLLPRINLCIVNGSSSAVNCQLHCSVCTIHQETVTFTSSLQQPIKICKGVSHKIDECDHQRRAHWMTSQSEAWPLSIDCLSRSSHLCQYWLHWGLLPNLPFPLRKVLVDSCTFFFWAFNLSPTHSH